MKKLKLIFTLLLGILSIAANAQFPFGVDQNALTKTYKANKVKSYQQYRIWEEAEIFDTIIMESGEVDKYGKITMINDTRDDDEYVYEYFYNNQGEVIKYTWKPVDGDEYSISTTYLVYEKGRLTFAYSLWEEDTNSKQVFLYNNENKLVKNILLQQNYDTKAWTDSIITDYTYDGNGRVLTESTRSSTVFLTEETTYTYNRDGTLSSSKVNIYEEMDAYGDGIYRPTITSNSQYTYNYDKKGNLISMEIHDTITDVMHLYYYRYTYR